MLRVNYRKLVPYPLPVVLSQYYDYEHIEHVHPDTLGRYRLLEVEGDRAVYEQIWPKGVLQRLGLRKDSVSLVEQTFFPPREIRFRFVSGRNRGVEVATVLEDDPAGTVVDETYQMPYLPDWRWLARLALPSIRKRVNVIWDEDIGVDVCHGGWPGVPESAQDPVGQLDLAQARPSDARRDGKWVDVAASEDLEPGRPLLVEAAEPGGEPPVAVVLVRTKNGIRALDNRCTHSGGPLSLGSCTDEEIVCPWHGARFCLRTGEPVKKQGESLPSVGPVVRYEVREQQGRLEILLVPPPRSSD